MLNAINGLKLTAIVVCGSIAFISSPAVAPLVSLVALPILGSRSLYHFYQERYFYKQTLNKIGQRAPCGRTKKQDYRQWNGKALPYSKVSFDEVNRLKVYEHGSQDDAFLSTTSPSISFSEFEDLQWLQREFKRKKAQDHLDTDLKMIRIFAKALIPVIGLSWVLLTENWLLLIENIFTKALNKKPDPTHKKHEDTVWTWEEAIQFHLKTGRRCLDPSST